MPIVFEVMLLTLLAYAIGLAIGWALWSHDATWSREIAEDEGDDE